MVEHRRRIGREDVGRGELSSRCGVFDSFESCLEILTLYCSSIVRQLNLVRVYTKPKGRTPDYNAPVVLRRGRCTVEDFCNAIHREIFRQLRYAVVWGASTKHPGQRCGGDHVLDDEDVVTLFKR